MNGKELNFENSWICVFLVEINLLVEIKQKDLNLPSFTRAIWKISPLYTRDETTVNVVDCQGKKKMKPVSSAVKVMATVLWDSREIIMIYHLEKGKTTSIKLLYRNV